MTKQFIYGSAVAALFATSLASCSSDDAIENEIVENKLAPINLTVGTESESTSSTIRRTGIIFSGTEGTLQGTQNVWEKNDVVWAYSTAKNYFNKLESVNNSSDKYHDKELNFNSGSNTVNYEAGERLILFNCGDDSGNTNLTTDESGANICLTRANDDNLMVSVYGDGSTVPTYTDEGNAFSMRRISAVVKEDGNLYKTSTAKDASTSAFQPAFTKILFSIPALNAEDAQKLAKLNYKIVVKLTDDDGNTGYPQTIKYKFDNTLSKKTSDNEQTFNKTYGVVKTWGEKPLQVTFKADADNVRHKSSSLWNTTDGALDANGGYVFFVLPAGVYTNITVKVRVEKPEDMTDTSLDNLCKTYTFTYQAEEEDPYDRSDINSKNSNSNSYFGTENLGAIWNRTSNSAKPAGFLARSSASTGWVVTEND